MRIGLLTLRWMLALVSACTRSAERPANPGSRQPAPAESPQWVFGEESTRTDRLPAALDSVAAWGEYETGTAPVAYAVDLNGDGASEYLVRGNRSVCGRAGCPILLYTPRADGSFAELLGALAKGVYVTNTTADGWPVLWVHVGGADGGLFRMVHEGGRGYVLDNTLFHDRELFAPVTPRVDSLMALLGRAPIR